MKKIAAILLLLFILALPAMGQGIQEKSVFDFSGGLVNSLTNALMQDNQALVLDNYRVTKGGLKRRPGLRYYYADTVAGVRAHGLIAYQQVDGKRLLVLRELSGITSNGIADSGLATMRLADPAIPACTTTLTPELLMYLPSVNPVVGANLQSITVNNDLVVGLYGSELMTYNGSTTAPVRPLGPNQPRSIPIDSGGVLFGTYTYKYAWITTGGDTTNLSLPTWPLYVNGSAIYVDRIGPNPAYTHSETNSKALIYRSVDGGSYYPITAINMIGVNLGTFVDTGYAVIDSARTYDWGDYFNCAYGDCDSAAADPTPYPPGCIYASWNAASSPYGVFSNIQGITDTQCVKIGYSVVFEDSAGRRSYAGPAACRALYRNQMRLFGADRVGYDLDSIPVPIDTQSIARKILLRGCFGEFTSNSQGKVVRVTITKKPSYGFQEHQYTVNSTTVGYYPSSSAEAEIDSLIKYWVQDLNAAVELQEEVVCSTNYAGNYFEIFHLEPGGDFTYGSPNYPTYDTIKVESSVDQAYLKNWVILDTLEPGQTSYSDSMPYDSIPGEVWCDDTNLIDDPVMFCYDDSAIEFQPRTIAYFNSRIYAAGYQTYPNRLYYSDFNRPGTWDEDKFLLLPTQTGDWINALWPVSNTLLIFRQNSIYSLTGANLYQYNLQPVSNSVGLAAPASLAEGRTGLYFLDHMGAYKFGNFQQRLSLPIDLTIDSLEDRRQRAVGAVVNGQYWLSLPITDSSWKTYVYSEEIRPHWSCYDFGFRDALLFDIDTARADVRSEQWVLAGTNDTMYQWIGGATDTLDGKDTIIATYQSKYFFESQGRVKALYFDLYGSGEADTVTLTFYENYGPQSTPVAVLTHTFVPDFTDHNVDRVPIDRIVDNLSVKITDNGRGDYTIKGYNIGFVPWDQGRQ